MEKEEQKNMESNGASALKSMRLLLTVLPAIIAAMIWLILLGLALTELTLLADTLSIMSCLAASCVTELKALSH